MSSRFRRPGHATVVAYLALFVALGGASYAAVKLPKNSVTSRQIKNGQVKGADLAKNAVTGAKVKNGSLLAGDFKPGQIPAGPQGPKGDPGPSTGPAGGALAGSYPNPTIAAGAVGQDQLATLKPGQVETGVWGFSAGNGSTTVSKYASGAISFVPRLPAGIEFSHVISTPSATPATHCSGPGHADPSYLCVYVDSTFTGASFYGAITGPSAGPNADGAILYFNVPPASFDYLRGRWAVSP